MLPIAMAFLLALGAPPPPPAPDPASPEAAPRYYHLFAQHTRELRYAISDIKSSLDEFSTFPRRAVDPDLPPLTPDEARRILRDAAPLIEGYSAAARLPAGDMKLDPFPEDSFESDDPRSSTSSSLGDAYHLIRADAARAWADHDHATFFRHAATIIRFGDHLAEQSPADWGKHKVAGLYISIGMDLAAEGMDRGALPDEPARAELYAALECIPAEDPTGIRRWWCRDWRRRLDEAHATLTSPDPERAATLHFSRLRNGIIFGGQFNARLDDLLLTWDVPVRLKLDFYERARGWIIWTYWPAVYAAIEAGVIPALPRDFIENRFANAEALCLRAEQAWSAGAAPDRINAITREAFRDSSRLATIMLVSLPSFRSDDLAVRARIDEFRARLDALAR